MTPSSRKTLTFNQTSRGATRFKVTRILRRIDRPGPGECNYSAKAVLLGKQVSPSRELMPSVCCCFTTVSSLSSLAVFTLFAGRPPPPRLRARVGADTSGGEKPAGQFSLAPFLIDQWQTCELGDILQGLLLFLEGPSWRAAALKAQCG